ncbi:MAG TPA: hypothetical protein VKW09_12465 [bacterium]|nr:hypothetical protein [bacterium]
MTTRRERRSTKPLSFYGIKFKMSAAATAPAKPLSESAQQEKENLTPDRITDAESGESIDKNTTETKGA